MVNTSRKTGRLNGNRSNCCHGGAAAGVGATINAQSTGAEVTVVLRFRIRFLEAKLRELFICWFPGLVGGLALPYETRARKRFISLVGLSCL